MRLGFTQEAAVALVDEQGLRSLLEIGRLDDGGVLSELCKTVRSPGGTIVGPNGDPVNNPGIVVSHKALNNTMQLLAFWMKHRDRISRPTEPADITTVVVESLRPLKERANNALKPEEKPKIDHKDWFKTLEAIKEYLAQCPGLTKIPLAYVIRDDESVPDAAEHPSANYTSHQHEMIRRAPHNTDRFQEDRKLVFVILREICENDAAFVYRKPAIEPRNGRLAYQLLYNHYLGQSAVEQLITKAEARLSTLAYTGKDTRRWTFETFVSQQKEQHALIDTLKTRGLHLGTDNNSKVMYLLTGLKDPHLEADKSQILNSSTLRNDFDASVRLCQDSLTLQSAQRTQLNISSTNVATGGSGEVEDHYFNRKEYSSLTSEQKDVLKQLRKKSKRGSENKKGSKMDSKDSSSTAKRLNKLSKLPRQISAIDSTLKAVLDDRTASTSAADDSLTDSEEEVQ